MLFKARNRENYTERDTISATLLYVNFRSKIKYNISCAKHKGRGLFATKTSHVTNMACDNSTQDLHSLSYSWLKVAFDSLHEGYISRTGLKIEATT